MKGCTPQPQPGAGKGKGLAMVPDGPDKTARMRLKEKIQSTFYAKEAKLQPILTKEMTKKLTPTEIKAKASLATREFVVHYE